MRPRNFETKKQQITKTTEKHRQTDEAKGPKAINSSEISDLLIAKTIFFPSLNED